MRASCRSAGGWLGMGELFFFRAKRLTWLPALMNEDRERDLIANGSIKNSDNFTYGPIVLVTGHKRLALEVLFEAASLKIIGATSGVNAVSNPKLECIHEFVILRLIHL